MVIENKQYQREFMCYSMNFLGLKDDTKDAEQLNKTDKIIMPECALDHLHRYSSIKGPYTFQLQNPKTDKYVYTGVLEFTSDNAHVIYVPRWLMYNLGLEEGGRVNVNSVTLEKGKSIKLRPQIETFFKLSNPKSVLERHLNNFTTLYQGEILTIKYLGRTFDIDVIETSPKAAIDIVGTDLKLEFVNIFTDGHNYNNDNDSDNDSIKSTEEGNIDYWENMGSGNKLN